MEKIYRKENDLNTIIFQYTSRIMENNNFEVLAIVELK